MSVHLAVPFRVEGDQAAVVADASLDEVIQNVDVTIRSRRGERLMALDVGIDDPTFTFRHEAPDLVEIEAAVAQWEPRAALAFSERREQGVTSQVQIGVRIKELEL